ncbi:DUF2877 domain-containing protein [Paenibacillus thiaminolyticus]|uniref:DUF2877 domain-containing protein n=1 Tax=Paenibacillus thiaminolyticus TaxID=49283 RepID=UPI0023507E35|nr:DUF2877 domain-containing protein [Paenibacillus thiaminolyticus]WCR24676.1 DUF2877 domain-containing protein [Paenibacillus thiaminolyticus]
MRPSSDFCNTPQHTNCLKGEEMDAQLGALLAQRPTGRVHSIFENGINLAMGDALIFVGTTKNGRLPFGIHMGQDSVKRLRRHVRLEDTVVAEGVDTIRFLHPGGPLTLDLAQAVPFQYEIRSDRYHYFRDIFHVSEFLKTCLTWGVPTGLDVEWDRFLANEYRPDEPQYAVVRQAEQLLGGLLSGEVQAVEAPLRYFLGRGPGLTPSGDDFLVGVLAVHKLTGAFHPACVAVLRHMVEREAITTDVSRAYLLHALQGRFSDKVTRVMNAMVMEDMKEIENAAPLNSNLEQMLETGHSSGIDTAFGIASAIMALRRNERICQNEL